MDFEKMSVLSSLFIRGFMEHMNESNVLKECGVAGREAVEEHGATISPMYISKLTRMLAKNEYIEKKKSGAHYSVVAGARFDEFFEWLADHDDWGTGMGSEEAISDRVRASRILDAGLAVKTGQDEFIPNEAWKYLWAAFKRGEVTLYLAPSDVKVVMVKDKKARKIHGWSGTEVEEIDE